MHIINKMYKNTFTSWRTGGFDGGVTVSGVTFNELWKT